MTKPKGGAASRAAGKASRRHAASRPGKLVTVGLATASPTPVAGFLAKTKLKRAGGSLVATVPAAARNMLHLTEGQEMAVTVEGSKVVMEAMPKAAAPLRRVRRPKYTIAELVAGMDPDAPLTDEQKAWRDAPPMGREFW